MTPEERREQRDRVGYLAGHALAGILANRQLIVGKTFGQIVDLAASYGEALERRVESGSAPEQG